MWWISLGFTTADWTAESNEVDALFGYSVSSAGDVNGDGYADVIIGAPNYENGGSTQGAAWVYLGSTSGLAATPGWTAESSPLGNSFGWSVAGGGDVNDDGFDDVLVTDFLYENGENNEGWAAVFHGSAVGLDTNAAWTAESDQADAWYGAAGAFAGDVNGDGFDDVVVSSTKYTNEVSEEGRVDVFHGSATGLAALASWTAESNQTLSLFGDTVASAGDVNGDGFDDVIVGAPFYDNGETDEGRAFVYLGSAAGLATAPGWTAESNQAFAFLGASVSSAGDVNDDGFDDVIVGASFFDNPEENEGLAYLFLGAATGLDTAPAWTTESNSVNASTGYSVSAAGDLNNDGIDDLVVGAILWDAGTPDEGALFVFLGAVTGLTATAEFILDSGQSSSFFGGAVAAAGDVDGDGYDDLLVGAPYYDNGENDEGRAYLYRGTCSDPIDTDGDLVGDRCDACPASYDPLQEDDDGDELGDVCDPCVSDTTEGQADEDGDGVCAAHDCDDANSTVYPNADELCDGLDNACSGSVPDRDLDWDGDGEAICAGDCDDYDAQLFSGQTEFCNGRDNNCDGEPSPEELDADSDGLAACGGDCDDTNVLVRLEFADVCGDGLDNDCDGAVDETCEMEAGDRGGCGCAGNGPGAVGLPALLLGLLAYGRSKTRTARSRATTSSEARHGAPTLCQWNTERPTAPNRTSGAPHRSPSAASASSAGSETFTCSRCSAFGSNTSDTATSVQSRRTERTTT